MKQFLLILVLSLALLSEAYADPDPVVVSWTLPTLNTNGTTIPSTGPASLGAIVIDYAPCLNGGLASPRLSKTLAGTATTTTIQILIVGDWCFTSRAINVAGVASNDSNISSKTVLIAESEPPILLTAVPSTDSVVLTLMLPTQNTNGTPIPASGNESLNHLDIRYSICLNGGLDGPNQLEQSGPLETTRTVPNLSPGEWCFAGAVQNVGEPGVHSDISNILSVTVGGVIPPIPEPPILTVATTTVYSVSKGDDTFLLAAVGTVPMGTACDGAQYIRGINETDKYHVVPVGDIDLWFGSVRSNVVVADCR